MLQNTPNSTLDIEAVRRMVDLCEGSFYSVNWGVDARNG